MNLGIVDLNLLTVFDAVMREGNVTKAGQRIGLSQSAVSHALNRLRHALKDDLFVRTSKGMVPTPFAERVAEPVARALTELRLAFESRTFVPAMAEMRFDIAIDTGAELALAPGIFAEIRQQAPFVRVDFRTTAVQDVPAKLDSGDVDLAIMSLDTATERFSHELVFEDRLVVLMRRDHPAARRDETRLPPDVFGDLEHLEIANSGTAEAIDRWCSENGFAYNVVLRAPPLAAFAIVTRSDVVAVGRRQPSMALIRTTDQLTFRDLPHDSPVIRHFMVWHRRFDNVAGHRWLRRIISAIGRNCREFTE